MHGGKQNRVRGFKVQNHSVAGEEECSFHLNRRFTEISFRRWICTKVVGKYKTYVNVRSCYQDHSWFRRENSPDQCGSVGWVSSCKAKGCWFDSWPGHVPALKVRVGSGSGSVREATSQSVFLSHLSLSLSPPLPFSSL